REATELLYTWKPCAGHGQVGTVQLQRNAGFDDGAVLRPHRVGDSRQICVVVTVVLVWNEEGHDARRGGAHEQPLGTRSGAGGFERSDVVLNCLQVLRL